MIFMMIVSGDAGRDEGDEGVDEGVLASAAGDSVPSIDGWPGVLGREHHVGLPAMEASADLPLVSPGHRVAGTAFVLMGQVARAAVGVSSGRIAHEGLRSYW
jgi:hypothetical protein